MSDYESMSREELIEYVRTQETRTAQLVATVKVKKETWDKTQAELEEALTDAKNRNEGLEFALKERNAELARVTKTLESMIAVADKRGNASADDKAKVEELEARLAATHEGLQVQKKDYDDKIRELRQQIQNEQLNVRVAEQKIRDLQEQLSVANDRAFDAESRLGRMQKAHATIVAERNRSQFSKASVATAKAAEEDADLAKDLEEIDMLGNELLNVDMGDLDLDFDLDEELNKPATKAEPVKRKESAAKPAPAAAPQSEPAPTPAAAAPATKKPAGALPPPTNPKQSTTAPKSGDAKKASVSWDELDNMLNDL